MNKSNLVRLIKDRGTVLCVGLDLDFRKVPVFVNLTDSSSILNYLKDLIDATRSHCIAYKPNLAFFEQLGSVGFNLLGELIEYIGKDHFKIADAKRGDIGNTAAAYAKTYFETFDFDAITVNPYMGFDSLAPFLAYSSKSTIVLGVTSNSGFNDIQNLELKDGMRLYQKVIADLSQQVTSEQLMFVVGATRGSIIESVRSLAPDHFFLMPGIGAQGGDLSEAVRLGHNKDYGLIINASRAIMYASTGEDFAAAAELSAKNFNTEIRMAFNLAALKL
jgi:orotidine-5'-phosphate decarboxylase